MVGRAQILDQGKLSRDKLRRLLDLTARPSPEVLVPAMVGEDAAVVRGRERLIVTADPITFTEENIGVYTVAVNCNDIVAMGGKPLYLTTTILLPPGTTDQRLETLFLEIEQAASRAGVLWVGGHTEVTTAVSRIVVSAQALGCLEGNPTRTADARPGELLVMSKWAALEATTLIARERPEISLQLLGREAHRQVLNWLYDPGISILKEGRILEDLGLSAAHDPTEGGIATGIHEIADRSGVGVRLFGDRIPVRKETELLCARFGIDPLGALSSGVFLFTASPRAAESACGLLQEQGVSAAVIGEINERAGRVELVDGSGSRPLPLFEKDEILKLG